MVWRFLAYTYSIKPYRPLGLAIKHPDTNKNLIEKKFEPTNTANEQFHSK